MYTLAMVCGLRAWFLRGRATDWAGADALEY